MFIPINKEISFVLSSPNMLLLATIVLAVTFTNYSSLRSSYIWWSNAVLCVWNYYEFPTMCLSTTIGSQVLAERWEGVVGCADGRTFKNVQSQATLLWKSGCQLRASSSSWTELQQSVFTRIDQKCRFSRVVVRPSVTCFCYRVHMYSYPVPCISAETNGQAAVWHGRGSQFRGRCSANRGVTQISNVTIDRTKQRWPIYPCGVLACRHATPPPPLEKTIFTPKIGRTQK